MVPGRLPLRSSASTRTSRTASAGSSRSTQATRGSTPKKRTALGRLKHENAAFAEAADGRAVVYTGDDERFQFLYKFVSTPPWRRHRRGASPLDEGTLFVARFDADGTGTWLPLIAGEVPGSPSHGEILVHTRGAAAAAGATPMDRPEWVAAAPASAGVAYGTFTNNTARTDLGRREPPLAQPFGHILRWRNDGGDHGAHAFTWSVFALAGRVSARATAPPSRPATPSARPTASPSTPTAASGSRPTAASRCSCNNQLLAADPVTGDLRRFLVDRRAARSPAGR